MPLSGDLRSVAKIMMDESQEDALQLVITALEKMKLKPKKIDEEKYIIHGRTKTNFFKNTWGAGFVILIKPSGNQSIIEIYYNGYGFNGPDTGTFIDPFYKKLSGLISNRPEMDVGLLEIKEEEIEETANESVRPNNTSDKANSIADEIAKLSKLKSEGALSEEEFTKMKNELIDKM